MTKIFYNFGGNIFRGLPTLSLITFELFIWPILLILNINCAGYQKTTWLKNSYPCFLLIGILLIDTDGQTDMVISTPLFMLIKNIYSLLGLRIFLKKLQTFDKLIYTLLHYGMEGINTKKLHFWSVKNFIKENHLI